MDNSIWVAVISAVSTVLVVVVKWYFDNKKAKKDNISEKIDNNTVAIRNLGEQITSLDARMDVVEDNFNDLSNELSEFKGSVTKDNLKLQILSLISNDKSFGEPRSYTYILKLYDDYHDNFHGNSYITTCVNQYKEWASSTNMVDGK